MDLQLEQTNILYPEKKNKNQKGQKREEKLIPDRKIEKSQKRKVK